jgi:hypothetical protein
MTAVVYTKTPKGLRESSGKTRELARDLRDLLKACNGLFTIEELSAQTSAEEREWIAAAILELVAEGYLRDVPEVVRETAEAAPESDGLDSLDFSDAGQKAAREAEEKARQLEEARRRKEDERNRQIADQKKREEARQKEHHEAEEKARHETEQREKARREAEAKARRDAEEKSRRDAADKARHEAEEKARREAAEKAHRDAEEKSRRDAAEKARRDAEARARREAEEKAAREAAERARLEEEERARAATSGGMDQVAGKLRADFASRRGQRDEATSELIKQMEEETRRKAEEKARLEAEEKARFEAEELARREAAQKARREAEERARREAEEKARIEAEQRAQREAEELARREAEEKLRREAAEKARREAEEKARIEAEERARREAEEAERRKEEDRLRRIAQEKARREAEERARIEAEERARREADEKVRREAEEKLRREAEEKARLEAEEKARIEAEERARREAEEAQRRKEEERLRRIAEKKARAEAEERARLEQEERDREAIRERIRQRNAKRRRIIVPAIFGLLLPLALGVLLLYFFSFDGKRADLEKSAAELFGVPVKIGSAKLWVLTGPQWMVEDVTIGTDADAVKIARVKLGLSSLFGSPARFDSIQMEGPRIPPAMALKLLIGTSGIAVLKSGELTATGLVIAGAQGMPPLNLRASWREGRLMKVSGQGENAESGKISLDMSRDDQWQLTLGATQVRWILGPSLPLTDVALKAILTPGGMTVSEFSGKLFDGEIAGSGNLTWQNNWRVAAKLEAKLLDPIKFAPAWAQDGRVNGNAAIVAEAANPAELMSRARISGSFNMGRGALAGIDLDKVPQEGGLGEQCRFESLKGDFYSDSHRIEISDLRLVAGALKASGALSVAPDRAVSGQIAVDVQSAGMRRGASVRIGGSLAKPQYHR